MLNAKRLYLFIALCATSSVFSSDNAALFDQGEPPLVITAQASPTDPFYPYIKRKPISTVANGPELLQRAVQQIDYIPWTLKSPTTANDQLFKLKDVVVDRITDPKTNIRYVKMYHGTTSDLVDVFRPGSSAIKFNAAQGTALGMGFYLAANINEAKAYACERLNARKKQNPSLQALLLVVGVREDDIIQGKLVTPSGIGKYSDYATGNPLDPSIYFVRNSNLYNQFVFFTNAAPYMKIFDIITLPSGFGKAQALYDYDGLPESSAVPDTNPSYKCPF